MTDFNQYRKSGVTAIYSRVPIQYLDEFRLINKRLGKYYKIRYRGPRNTPLDYNRGYLTRQATCLKGAATCFSVYQY